MIWADMTERSKGSLPVDTWSLQTAVSDVKWEYNLAIMPSAQISENHTIGETGYTDRDGRIGSCKLPSARKEGGDGTPNQIKREGRATKE